MLAWLAQTALIAALLALLAELVGRGFRLGPAARHTLWLVVLIKFVVPPVVRCPWPALVPCPATEKAARPSSAAETTVARAAERTEPEDDPTIEAVPAVVAAPAIPAAPPSRRPEPIDPAAMGRWALAAWGCLAALLAIRQGGQVVRVRRWLRRARPAPGWLVAEARDVGARLGTRVPEMQVVPGPGTPFLWCLGRPRLILPGALVETLGVEGWRGILAHELAHLRRGDHWVRRLEMAAGLLWWWCPLFWLTRRRLEAEAELACDAWAVGDRAADRLAYAEALLTVCRSLPAAVPPAPALGVAGAGRFLERRVTMILHDEAPPRTPTPVLIGAGLLGLLALPAWGMAVRPLPAQAGPPAAATRDEQVACPVNIDVDDDDPEDEADRADDPEKKDDAPGPDARPRRLRKSESRRHARDAARGERDDDQDEDEDDKDLDDLGEEIARMLEKELGPGSEFQKAMEALGPHLEDLNKSLGPGSEFQKAMEALGPRIEKEVNKRLGPGSDFEKAMNKLGEEMEAKFGPGSDFQKRIEARSRPGAKAGTRPSPRAGRARSPEREAPPKPKAKAERRSKERRIRELEARIQELRDELKSLQDEDDADREDEDDEAGGEEGSDPEV